MKAPPNRQGLLGTLAAVARLASRGVGNRAARQRTKIGARKAALKARGLPVFRRSKRNTMRPTMVKGQQGGLASYSKCVLSNRPSKRVQTIERAGSTANYLVNSAYSVSCEQGFQGFGGGDTFNKQDLLQIQKKIPTNINVPAPKTPPFQYVISRIHTEYLLTNNTTATTYVDIYDIVRKRDANSSDLSGGTVTPWNAWQQGVYNQDTLGTFIPGSSDLSGALVLKTLPTDSRLFKDWFKVVRRHKVGLTPGATHRHQVLLSPNKLMDSNLVASVDGDMAGCVVYTMFVVMGQPAVIYLGEEHTREVTSSAGILDIVQSNKYTYFWVANNETNYFINDNLLTSAVGGTAEQIVQAYSGDIKVIQEA